MSVLRWVSDGKKLNFSPRTKLNYFFPPSRQALSSEERHEEGKFDPWRDDSIQETKLFSSFLNSTPTSTLVSSGLIRVAQSSISEICCLMLGQSQMGSGLRIESFSLETVSRDVTSESCPSRQRNILRFVIQRNQLKSILSTCKYLLRPYLSGKKR